MLTVKTRQKREKIRKESYWKRQIEIMSKPLSKLEKVYKRNYVLFEKDKKEIICKYDLDI